MSTPSDPEGPRPERPSTYVVQDRSSQDELERLKIQDQMLTTSMGGPLPEQPDPTIFKRVLDVGCGTGSWLIETAVTYPDMSVLIGIDISGKMIEYARSQADEQQVSDRVEFQVMDVLRLLEFPDRYFDLVNLRLGISYLRTWDWPNILQELQRVTKAGGVIRLTECDITSKSNSLAQQRLYQLLTQTFYQSGHLFNENGDSVIQELAPLLNRYGLRNVQTRTYTLSYQAGTIESQRALEDIRLLFKTLIPFFRKWTHLPDDYDALYQQMLNDTQQPGYTATGTLLTAWGNTR